ncbi:MAG: DUF2007 domain-containing protein, partial [Gammaproteobacteria bacterium]
SEPKDLGAGIMKRVYCSEDRLLVGFLKGVLDGHRIDCLVKNEYLIGGIGELPPGACWPELWVIEESDLPQARTLIASVLKGGSSTEPWCCTVCGEWIEPQFAECWQCAQFEGELP